MSALTKDPDRFVETEIDEETVVMLLDSGDFFSLQGTARTIWKLLDGKRDRAAILAELQGCFEAPVEALAADLDAFLAELDTAGLLARS